MSESTLPFEFPQSKLNIIKVVGVGGGGGNAVSYMHNEGIQDVSFAICNTDCQALAKLPIPIKVQLGHEGLGAGNDPEKGRESAEESKEEIMNMLNDGTRMVFITATMGGGTGTGAAPVVARIAKELNILTVGIVTIPFLWEGNTKIRKALTGVINISKYVDALLVINNQRLIDIYPDLTLSENFAKANDTLKIAAKGISEIITKEGKINNDFNDVKSVLQNGGVAIMSTGYGEGEKRVTMAIDEALNSPLLYNKNIFNARKVLFNISYSTQKEIMTQEVTEIHEFMSKFKMDYELKWGLYEDDSLDDKIRFTLLATGFEINDIIEEKTEKTPEDEKTDSMIDEYYGTNKVKGIKQNKRIYSYIFQNEDLDNEQIIHAVSQTPTYTRTSLFQQHIQSLAKDNESQNT